MRKVDLLSNIRNAFVLSPVLPMGGIDLPSSGKKKNTG
jgi:hypothetical protein